MKNIYNKGTFRSYEWGKIPPYLKKHGNKKWRRTEKSEIEDQLSETVRFFKQRRKRQKLIRAKITREINGRIDSEYRSFYSEKSFKSSIGRAHVTRYFLIHKTSKK
jgi:protease II